MKTKSELQKQLNQDEHYQDWLEETTPRLKLGFNVLGFIALSLAIILWVKREAVWLYLLYHGAAFGSWSCLTSLLFKHLQQENISDRLADREGFTFYPKWFTKLGIEQAVTGFLSLSLLGLILEVLFRLAPGSLWFYLLSGVWCLLSLTWLGFHGLFWVQYGRHHAFFRSLKTLRQQQLNEDIVTRLLENQYLEKEEL